MAKYARFDPRNKKRNKNQISFTEKKTLVNQKKNQHWREYLEHEENDISSLRGKTFETV
jgi:hypothetical protein